MKLKNLFVLNFVLTFFIGTCCSSRDPWIRCSTTATVLQSFVADDGVNDVNNVNNVNGIKGLNASYYQAFLTFDLEEKSTICLKSDDGKNFLTLELVSYEVDRPISGHYRFGLPDLVTQCHCQCDASTACRFPGCGDQAVCFNKTVFGARCKSSFGQICCSTKISPSDKSFRAFRLAPPRPVLTFKLRQIFSESRQSSETVFRVTGSSGAKLGSQETEIFLRSDFSSFQSSDFEPQLVGNDWVVTSSEIPEKHFSVEKTFINDFAEFSPSKLGWFRSKEDGVGVTSSVVLSKSLDVTTSDCDAATFNVVFHGVTSSTDLSLMLQPLQDSVIVDTARRVVRVKPATGN